MLACVLCGEAAPDEVCPRCGARFPEAAGVAIRLACGDAILGAAGADVNAVSSVVARGGARDLSQEHLSYFYSDWYDARAAIAAGDRVRDAASRYGAARGAAVALGSCAGRLPSMLARSFSPSFGVDHCIGALQLARRVLDGEAVSLTIRDADWAEVEIRAPSQLDGPVRLIAGDVAALPFEDESIALASAQYLLDVIPDARVLAHEINRVLADGGLWTGLDLPFSSPPHDPRAIVGPDRIGAFLESFGFELLEVSSPSFAHRDFSAAAPFAPVVLHRPTWFVARKTRALPPDPVAAALRSFFAGDPAALRAARATLSPGTSIDVTSGTTFSSDKHEEVSVVFAVFPSGRKSATRIVPLVAKALRKALAAIDGRPLAAIYDVARDAFGGMAEDDFARVVLLLYRRGLLTVTTKEEGGSFVLAGALDR